MSWSSSPPNLQQARSGLVASVDSNGDIIASGGAFNIDANSLNAEQVFSSTEIYNGESWESGPDMSQERYRMAVARDSSDNVYVVGGVDSNGNLLSSVEYWDGSSWTSIPDLPVSAQAGYAGSDAQDNIYHIGGAITQNNIVTNEIYRYDGSSWSSIGFIPNDQGYEDLILNGASLSDSQGDIYLIGGFGFDQDGNGSELSQVLKYSSGSFSQLDSLSEPRDTLSSATPLDDTIYVSGGAAGDQSYNTLENFRGSSWNLRSGMNIDRAGHSLVSGSKGRIYAIGGTSISSSTTDLGETLSSVERFNPAPPAPSSVSLSERN